MGASPPCAANGGVAGQLEIRLTVNIAIYLLNVASINKETLTSYLNYFNNL